MLNLKPMYSVYVRKCLYPIRWLTNLFWIKRWRGAIKHEILYQSQMIEYDKITILLGHKNSTKINMNISFHLRLSELIPTLENTCNSERQRTFSFSEWDTLTSNIHMCSTLCTQFLISEAIWQNNTYTSTNLAATHVGVDNYVQKLARTCVRSQRLELYQPEDRGLDHEPAALVVNAALAQTN